MATKKKKKKRKTKKEKEKRNNGERDEKLATIGINNRPGQS